MGYSYSHVSTIEATNGYPLGVISETPFYIIEDEPKGFERGFMHVLIDDIHFIVYILNNNRMYI